MFCRRILHISLQWPFILDLETWYNVSARPLPKGTPSVKNVLNWVKGRKKKLHTSEVAWKDKQTTMQYTQQIGNVINCSSSFKCSTIKKNWTYWIMPLVYQYCNLINFNSYEVNSSECCIISFTKVFMLTKFLSLSFLSWVLYLILWVIQKWFPQDCGSTNNW